MKKVNLYLILILSLPIVALAITTRFVWEFIDVGWGIGRDIFDDLFN